MDQMAKDVDVACRQGMKTVSTLVLLQITHVAR